MFILGLLLVNNGEQFEEFFRPKSNYLKEIKRNQAGETQCVRGIRDFEESVFDQNLFHCIHIFDMPNNYRNLICLHCRHKSHYLPPLPPPPPPGRFPPPPHKHTKTHTFPRPLFLSLRFFRLMLELWGHFFPIWPINVIFLLGKKTNFKSMISYMENTHSQCTYLHNLRFFCPVSLCRNPIVLVLWWCYLGRQQCKTGEIIR